MSSAFLLLASFLFTFCPLLSFLFSSMFEVTDSSPFSCSSSLWLLSTWRCFFSSLALHYFFFANQKHCASANLLFLYADAWFLHHAYQKSLFLLGLKQDCVVASLNLSATFSFFFILYTYMYFATLISLLFFVVL